MRTSRLNLCFVALWMAILLANLGVKASHRLIGWPGVESRVPLRENRELAPFPSFRALPLREWGARFGDWYDDHFARRPDVIRLHNDLQFRLLKHPIQEQVPGVGDWVFRRSGNWPECEDFLGAKEISAQDLADWRTLLEGRAAWAEAHGTRYLQVLTPVKAQMHAEKMPPLLRRLRGTPVRGQVAAALAGSFAETNLLCLSDALSGALASGREVFYHDDHHVNAYGCHLLYAGIVERLGELWFPGMPSPPPFYDDPPSEVVERRAPGCYEAYNRLEVSVPGSRMLENPSLGIGVGDRHYPMVPVYVEQPGEHRYAVFGHDSFLRYPLYSWHRRPPAHFALPMGLGFDRLAMLIFTRFDTRRLDAIVRDEVPDVIVEQFPESKLLLGPIGLDETMRRAAAFGRGTDAGAPPAAAPESHTDGTDSTDAAAPPAVAHKSHTDSTDSTDAAAHESLPLGADLRTSRPYLARAVFERVSAPNGCATARLLAEDGAVLAEEPVSPGARRAVFFAPVETHPARVEIVGGNAAAVRLDVRKTAP